VKITRFKRLVKNLRRMKNYTKKKKETASRREDTSIMSGSIKIKFLGILKKTYGRSRISLETRKSEKLRDIIQRVAESSPELERVLIDPELKDPRPNVIILVNGKEISVLKGLETEVRDRDEIVFIPVIHGG